MGGPPFLLPLLLQLCSLLPLLLRSALEAVVAADVELMQLRADEQLLNEQLQVGKGGMVVAEESVGDPLACGRSNFFAIYYI